MSASDLGNDVLEVHGDTGTLDADGKPVTITAYGWVSAMTNHYPLAAFDAQGNHLPGVNPRAMTPAERLTYCRNLLLAVQHGSLTPPVNLNIQDP